MRRRRQISESEKQRRAQQRARALAARLAARPAIPPGEINPSQLYDRVLTGAYLNLSQASLIRMEARGLLTALRPTGSANGKVQYVGANLIAVRDGTVAVTER
jgi:hypothetical protein